MLMFTTVFSSFLHVYYLANVNDIKDVQNVFDGNIAYFNIFTLQSGVSFCFLVFAHIGFFSENIRLIVKLKKIRELLLFCRFNLKRKQNKIKAVTFILEIIKLINKIKINHLNNLINRFLRFNYFK